jgi:hypothetical protein
VQAVNVIIFDPQGIASWDSGEVESPFCHPAEVIFLKIPIAVGGKHIQQVETPPTR